jgi:acyl-CoA thioester hydrolase
MNAAFVGFEGVVGDDWIDFNGHMNVDWYDHVFDAAESRLFTAFGVDEAYVARTRHGMFRIEKAIRYEHELLRGDRIRVTGRIAAFDGRGVRHTHELVNVETGRRAATATYASLNVDLSRRKVAAVADPDVLAALRALASAHGAADVFSTRR